MRKNKTEGLILSDFKVYYKVTVIKIVSWWHKGRHADQQNTTEGLKINPYSSDELIFERVPKKKKSLEERVVFSKNGAGTTGHLHVKE